MEAAGLAAAINESQEFPEQVPRHRHFCQLESNIPAVADDLGADPD